MILGMLATGVAMVGAGRPTVVAGVIVIATGGVCAWAGGVMHDVHASKSVQQEVAETKAGHVHEGISTLQRSSDQVARREAVHVTERAKAARARSQSRATSPWPDPTLGPIGLLVVSAWMITSPWWLEYPFEPAPQDAQARQIVVAIIATLSALWLMFVGRTRTVLLICLLVGLGLVLASVGYPHGTILVQVNGVICGALVSALAALSALSSNDRRR